MTVRRPRSGRVVAGALAVLVVLLSAPFSTAGTAVVEPSASSSQTQTFWVTSPTDPTQRLIRTPPSTLPATAWVRVDPTSARQTWWGSGAAVTDASVQLLAGRRDLVRLLFDADSERGAR